MQNTASKCISVSATTEPNKYQLNRLKQSDYGRGDIWILQKAQSDDKAIVQIIIDYLRKVFEHKTDFDENNGICYHIACNRGQRVFANPVNAGFIKMTSSRWNVGKIAKLDQPFRL